MGCDIHTIAQRREGDGWVEVTGDFSEGAAPFDWRQYSMYGFLAGVRNYSAVPPISKPRGLPADLGREVDDDPWLGDHNYSWLSVEELTSFDYEQQVEDRRTTGTTPSGVISGAITAEPGAGEMMTFRELLGDQFMRDLKELRRIGAERIVFGFDS